MPQTVSIIIVNWNGINHLKPLFESINALDFDKKKLEVIMVDNASEDDSVKFTKKNFPWVKVLNLDRNYGFCRGNNEGIKIAKGECILLLNNDTVADKGLLKALLSAFEDDVAAVGGKVYEWNEENPEFNNNNKISSSWPKINNLTAKPFNFTDERPAKDVDYLPGCMVMVKKEVIDEIGALDEGFGSYFEETDWCARMIRAGYGVRYTPEAVIWHRVAATSNALSNDFNHRMMTRNRIRFALKNFDFTYVLFFLFYYLFEVFGKFLRLCFYSIKSLFQSNSANSFLVNYYSKDLLLVMQSVLWNLLNSLNTSKARKRDFGKIKNKRSYNRNLPLNNVKPNRRDI